MNLHHPANPPPPALPKDTSPTRLQGVAEALTALSTCEAACKYCGECCAAEPAPNGMGRCVEFNADCVASCAATTALLNDMDAFDAPAWRAQLQACIASCLACALECETHGSSHEHCRSCADACRRCESACRKLDANIAAMA